MGGREPQEKGEEVRGGEKSTYRGQGTEKVGHIPDTKTSRCAAMEVGGVGGP